MAGVASLVWSANPYLRATDVHAIMANTAVDLGAFGYDMAYGHGFVNADAAVRQALAIYRMNGQMGLTPSGLMPDSLMPNWEAALATSQASLAQLQPLSTIMAAGLAIVTERADFAFGGAIALPPVGRPAR